MHKALRPIALGGIVAMLTLAGCAGSPVGPHILQDGAMPGEIVPTDDG